MPTSVTGNFTADSTYARNRDLVLLSLASNVTARGGFYNTTIGLGNDTVYVLVLCISDPSAESCSICVNSAIQALMAACPNQKEAISWGGEPVPCFVRYANHYLFGSLELSPTDSGYNTGILETNTKEFGQIWTSLMTETVRRPSMGSSRLKYIAFGKVNLTSFMNIYVLMQCTPDISQSNCSYWLQESVVYFKGCCYGKKGGYVQKPNWFLRWDLYPFYNIVFPEVLSPSPPSIISSPSPTNNIIRKGKGYTASRIVIFTVVPTAIFYLDENSSIECWLFKFATIKLATNNFSDDNKLGQGGFGVVYKGVLADGKAIAVKKLSSTSGQGEVEFKNEVHIIAKLEHKNLVRFLGCCMEGTEKLLIYEFQPNSSLDQFIIDPKKRLLLSLEMRFKIIEGIARGILYLHQDSQLRVIHRDLKASNILLDEEMNAKISDFGMAKLTEIDQSQDATSRIARTSGYTAPEYAMHGLFSVKSDVFSFGVLVLEIITGRKNSSSNHGEVQEYLLTSTWDSWNQGRAVNLLDPVLTRVSSRSDEVIRYVHIGLLCVQENVEDRPVNHGFSYYDA